jgi:hypothetical protein
LFHPVSFHPITITLTILDHKKVQLSPGLENIAQCPQCMVQCCQHCLHVMPSHKHVSDAQQFGLVLNRTGARSHTFSTTQFQPSIFRCYCSNVSFEWLAETRGFALAVCFVTVNTPKVLSCTICKDVSCLHTITLACQVSWDK